EGHDLPSRGRPGRPRLQQRARRDFAAILTPQAVCCGPLTTTPPACLTSSITACKSLTPKPRLPCPQNTATRCHAAPGPARCPASGRAEPVYLGRLEDAWRRAGLRFSAAAVAFAIDPGLRVSRVGFHERLEFLIAATSRRAGGSEGEKKKATCRAFN